MNRRKALSIIAQSSAAASSIGLTQQSLAADKPNPAKKPITIAGYKLDRTLRLTDGSVAVKGFEHIFEEAAIGDANTHVFSGPATREVTEIGLHPFMLAYANENFRKYSLLPIFPIRVFRHKSIFIRTDRGITKPEDLKGRRIGTPGFSSTSLTWIRGILQHEYGVKPTDVEWVVSAKDSSADSAGKLSKQESVVPTGLSVSTGTAGKDESQLLVDGEVDALFHAAEPKAFIEGNPIVGRLFPDFRSTEQAYYKKTGIFPIMHAVAIHNDVAKQFPELPMALCHAYSEAKNKALAHIVKMAWADISLPWVAKDVEETRKLMGDNFWPYGIEPNRKTLNALFQYSHEQGLAKKQLTIEELFHPSTLEFLES
ncbi:ABC transporter substrate-binding protein [Verrucomicrobiaceae bacterium N1E253]|uniref:ABC transporter substrate-binding protein n=1 Tax=Oceaniferula marina TaxID=2748318 RepID=A0A851GQN4_9BACT|nr:ABC transporter substrate-binding protein [Oceaniferula marina]NWK56484.1 ABC transporter substrate-binding protein [Oceaniferula marina]